MARALEHGVAQAAGRGRRGGGARARQERRGGGTGCVNFVRRLVEAHRGGARKGRAALGREAAPRAARYEVPFRAPNARPTREARGARAALPPARAAQRRAACIVRSSESDGDGEGTLSVSELLDRAERLQEQRRAGGGGGAVGCSGSGAGARGGRACGRAPAQGTAATPAERERRLREAKLGGGGGSSSSSSSSSSRRHGEAGAAVPPMRIRVDSTGHRVPALNPPSELSDFTPPSHPAALSPSVPCAPAGSSRALRAPQAAPNRR